MKISYVIFVAAVALSTGAAAQPERISDDRYLKACLFSAAERLPKTPGLVIESSTGKVDRQGSDGAIVSAAFEVSALGIKATYRFLCGYKGTQTIPIQGVFVE